MNLGELKEQIVAFSHRNDLDHVIQQFIDNTSQRLGRRFGVMPAPLLASTDTNSLLTTHSSIYLYGSLREQGIYTHDVAAVDKYEQLYQTEIRELNINYQDWDWAAEAGPVMCPARSTCGVDDQWEEINSG